MKNVPLETFSDALFSVTMALAGKAEYWLLGPLLPMRKVPVSVVVVPGARVSPPARTYRPLEPKVLVAVVPARVTLPLPRTMAAPAVLEATGEAKVRVVAALETLSRLTVAPDPAPKVMPRSVVAVAPV